MTPPDTGTLTEAEASSTRLAPFASRAQLSALLELTKPSITTLVMVTMVSGALAASRPIVGYDLALSMFATACVVGAANAFNMWMERDSDAFMSRTRKRPLPTGRLTPELVLGFGSMLAVVGLTLLAMFVSSLAALLGWVAMSSYVLAYTPLKRVTPWSLHVGAVPGAIPPLIGWASVTGSLSREAFALFAILFVWQLPHFLAIATFRAPEYERAGLKVMPNVNGAQATERAIIGYSALLGVVALAPWALGMAGVGYGLVALLSSLAFLGVALHGRGRMEPHRWARRLFLASMPYLVVVFAAFVASRV
ncbi:MAG: protoheme IX farnesyltransferase [Myxococcales bacterium]|nr:MAG: protoheme IX farnesyltransferase [Myxococcales bacterium]